jgi:hypothetical protein
MNKTNTIAIIGQKPEDIEEAQIYFKEKYGDMVKYDFTTDSFIYRGVKFDYFKDGVAIFPGEKNSYCFLDPRNPRLFLWNDQIIEDYFNGVPPMKTGWESSIRERKLSLVERFFIKIMSFI